MKTIEISNIPEGELDALEQFAEGTTSPIMREALLGFSEGAREGKSVAFVDGGDLSPSQAAQLIHMSRVHLYKLLDSGEIASHKVGKHRRIRLIDLKSFEAKRESDRLELAEKFAHQQSNRKAAIDEIADLI